MVLKWLPNVHSLTFSKHFINYNIVPDIIVNEKINNPLLIIDIAVTSAIGV